MKRKFVDMWRCCLSSFVFRVYLALASLLVFLTIERPLVNAEWDTSLAFGAGLTDVGIVCLMLLFYKMLLMLCNNTRLRKAVSWFFLFVALLIIVFAVLAQILFIKTGEILNLPLIELGIREASSFFSVASGEFSFSTFKPLLQTLAFLCFVVTALQSMRSVIRYSAYVTLVLPLFFLSVSYATDLHFQRELSRPTPFHEKGRLYQGAYLNMTDKQLAWNSSARQGWSMGILSGATVGNAVGRLEFETYRNKAGYEEVYRIDHVEPEKTGVKPNVLMIVLESIRADAVGVYADQLGEEESHTPFIDQYAEQGYVIDQAYTTIPHTSKALVGLYCGVFPRFDPEILEGEVGGLSDLQCLPELLGQAGYASAHFQAAPAEFENRKQLLENLKFDHFTTQDDFVGADWEQLGYLGMDDRALIDPIVEWISSRRQNNIPFFASMLTVVTHHPYASPGNVEPIASVDEAHQAYLQALSYSDTLLRELVERLDRRGLLENTYVIITGDHGEGFGEHGQIAHNGTAYNEGMRVPLIIVPPGGLATPSRISGLHQHLDILPTVLALAGVRIDGILPGIDIFEHPEGHKELITSCYYEDYCLTHVDSSGEKLIYLFGRKEAELYDVLADPFERKNILAAAEDLDGLISKKIFSAVRMRNSYDAVWISD